MTEQESKAIFRDVYNFYVFCMGKVRNGKPSMEDVCVVGNAFEDICRRHNRPFCGELLVAVIGEMERGLGNCQKIT